MQAYSAGQSRVGVRGGVVQATARDGGQALGQASYGGLVGEPYLRQAEAVARVHPDLAGAVDQDVGDARVAEEGFERAGTDEVGAYLVGQGEHLGVA